MTTGFPFLLSYIIIRVYLINNGIVYHRKVVRYEHSTTLAKLIAAMQRGKNVVRNLSRMMNDDDRKSSYNFADALRTFSSPKLNVLVYAVRCTNPVCA